MNLVKLAIIFLMVYIFILVLGYLFVLCRVEETRFIPCAIPHAYAQQPIIDASTGEVVGFVMGTPDQPSQPILNPETGTVDSFYHKEGSFIHNPHTGDVAPVVPQGNIWILPNNY